MRNKTYFLFAAVSLFAALALGLLSLFALRALNEGTVLDFHRQAVLAMARFVEEGPLEGSLARYQVAHPDSHLFRSRIWVLSEDGRLLSSNTSEPPPSPWFGARKPDQPLEYEAYYPWLGIMPMMSAVRLNSKPAAYLVMMSNRGAPGRRRDLLEIALFGLALAFSALLSVSFTFIYLRRKSRQARAVLLRLEHGDLKARFAIKQFDELGSLMLDFNRMASEIERLVGRLQEAEQARKSLFQELSHDLRTPLTSLRTSIETLGLHWREMSEEHRDEILQVCRTETEYFLELLESLLFIAQMDEPRYKAASEPVDLVEILESEMHVRQTQQRGSAKPQQWELELPRASKTTVPGDAQLLRRLVKNALENAARFARTRVRVRLEERGPEVILSVEDDGPGMSSEELSQFGKVRSRRTLSGSSGNGHVSLGLGSVIMTKIVELHKGHLQLESTGGTRLAVTLPAR